MAATWEAVEAARGAEGAIETNAKLVGCKISGVGGVLCLPPPRVLLFCCGIHLEYQAGAVYSSAKKGDGRQHGCSTSFARPQLVLPPYVQISILSTHTARI